MDMKSINLPVNDFLTGKIVRFLNLIFLNINKFHDKYASRYQIQFEAL